MKKYTLGVIAGAMTADSRVLDVGCGGGFLLAHFDRAGWETVGVEPSTTAAGYARDHGLDVRTGLLGEVELEGRFDAVHCSLVLEHLLFQGTSNRSALDIARLMDGAGGQVGARSILMSTT